MVYPQMAAAVDAALAEEITSRALQASCPLLKRMNTLTKIITITIVTYIFIINFYNMIV
jgi:hypothetical protein